MADVRLNVRRRNTRRGQTLGLDFSFHAGVSDKLSALASSSRIVDSLTTIAEGIAPWVGR